MSATLVDGAASGEVFVLEKPLSFWGGFDPRLGLITDVSHPQHGQSLAGRVLVMRHGRGSSSSSAVLAEALRVGTGPAAILLGEPDQIVVTGVLVARLLYGVQCPVVLADLPADARGVWQVQGSEVTRID